MGWELESQLPRDWTETVVNTSDKLVLQLNMINYMWIICLKLTVFTSAVFGLGALVHIIIFHFQYFPQGLNLRTGMQKPVEISSFNQISRYHQQTLSK